MASVLLDGKPMTREALGKVLVAKYGAELKIPHTHAFEFDIAERIPARMAMRIHEWCYEHGIATSYHSRPRPERITHFGTTTKEE